SMAKLQREVEDPRPRSSAAAVVAVASLAMFTAIGASTLFLRTHFGGCPHMRASTGPRAEIPELVTSAARADVQRALEVYPLLERSPEPLPAVFDAARRRSADDYVAAQLFQIEEASQRGDCDAVKARLAAMRYLLPGADLPVTTARCAPSAVRVDVVFAPSTR